MKILSESLVEFAANHGVDLSYAKTKRPLSFTLNKKRTKISVRGHAEVFQVFGSKSDNQIVVRFEEEAASNIYEDNEFNHNKITCSELKEHISNGRHFSFHPKATYKIIVKNEEGKVFKDTDFIPSNSYYDFKITQKIPKRKTTLLLGTDETNSFICMLPKNVSSVSAAHKCLSRGKDLLRVGEYFFEPTDNETRLAIEQVNYFNTGNWYLYSNSYDPVSIEHIQDKQDIWVDSSNHQASLIAEYNDFVYVRGNITDSRGSHRDLFLETWHKVLPNREILNEGEDWD